MAFSLNKIMLIGNLGQDAEHSFTSNNVSVSKFSIATVHSFKTREGNWQDETTWHNVTAFNLSDYYKDNLKKGKKVYVEGRLSKREYTDREGIKRYFTEVFMEKLIPLEGREGSSSYSPSSSSDNNSGNNNNYNRESIDSAPEDDDLPF